MFETLLLNLLPYTRSLVDDIPAWESDAPFARDDLHNPAKQHVPRGYLDYLTWQPRRVTLYPQPAGYEIIVREMKFTQGVQLLVPDALNLDPMKSYTDVGDENEPRFYPATFRRQGAWYNWLDLLRHRNAAVLCRVDDLPVSSPRHYLAVGMETAKGQARVDAYHRERLLFSFDSNAEAEPTDVALDMVQAVRRQLWGAMYRLAETYIAPLADQEGMKPDKNDVQAKMSHWGWESDFWLQVETCFTVDNISSACTWIETLENIAWNTLNSVVDKKLPDLAREKAAALARRQLGAGLRKIKEEGKENES